MIVITENSRYELDERHRRLRRVGDADWIQYEGDAKVVVGEPLRLYARVTGGGARSLSAYRMWSSSPVVDVIDERGRTPRRLTPVV